MRKMGIEALYRKPNTSRRHAAHPVFPYLLRHLTIERPNARDENVRPTHDENGRPVLNAVGQGTRPVP